MCRLAVGCSTESHPLYGLFMARLSGCIFEWDKQDYVISAKRGEMVQAGVVNPTDTAVKKAISKDELARHCRRRTRGAEKTTELIEELILTLSSVTDLLGVPLLKDDMNIIWEEQKKHVPCIQDPPDVELYTTTGYLTKGGVKLPILRCAHGSTSLESFHLHLAHFIPGTAANAVNFQAYLLDGITRWNAARASTGVQSPEESVRTYDLCLQEKVNALSQAVHGVKVFQAYHPPAKYTGAFWGRISLPPIWSPDDHLR